MKNLTFQEKTVIMQALRKHLAELYRIKDTIQGDTESEKTARILLDDTIKIAGSALKKVEK